MKTLKSAHFFGVSMVSKLIQFQTGPYSHSAVYLDYEDKEYIKTMTGKDIPEEVNLIEQWPHDGGMESWMDYNSLSNHTPGTRYEVWGLDMPNFDWEFCLSRYIKSCEIKREYDWAGIVHFRIKSVKEDPDKTFCSEELIIPICQIMGWNTVQTFNVHPTMAVNLIQAGGGKKLFETVT